MEPADARIAGDDETSSNWSLATGNASFSPVVRRVAYSV